MAIRLSELPESLRNAELPVEVFDDRGNRVGWYNPIPPEPVFGVPPPGFTLEISEEEIARRRKECTHGKTISEVLKRLESEAS